MYAKIITNEMGIDTLLTGIFLTEISVISLALLFPLNEISTNIPLNQLVCVPYFLLKAISFN